MTGSSEVWLLCLVTKRPIFPNLSVLGVYTTQAKAEEAQKTLPKDKYYMLYRVPVDQFVGHIKKNGDLQDGMGQLWHHHFEPEGFAST